VPGAGQKTFSNFDGVIASRAPVDSRFRYQRFVSRMDGVAELWKDCRTYVIPTALLSDSYSTDLPPEDDSSDVDSESQHAPEPGQPVCSDDDPTPRAYRYAANERPLIFKKSKDPFSPIYDRNDARPWFGLSCSERPACSDEDTEIEAEAEVTTPILQIARLPQPSRCMAGSHRRRRPSMPANGSALGYTSYLPFSIQPNNLDADSLESNSPQSAFSKRSRNSNRMQNSVFATRTVRKLIMQDPKSGRQVAAHEEHHSCTSTAANERENPALWWLSLAAVSG
jgi:hypothetical protein